MTHTTYYIHIRILSMILHILLLLRAYHNHIYHSILYRCFFIFFIYYYYYYYYYCPLV